MKSVAHISFEGGGLIVPAQTPYERELLFEHVEISAKRHGCVRLDVNRGHWRISLCNGDREACASCRRGLDSLIYRFEDQTLCGQCARRTLR
jgi:hypothetical protein